MYRGGSSRSTSPPPLPPPGASARGGAGGTTRRVKKYHRSDRNRGYDMPTSRDNNKSPPPPPQSSRHARRGGDVTLLLCIFHTTSHNWATASVRFNPNRINDVQLWREIRDTYRSQLEKPWRRILGLKRVRSIVPCAFSPNGIPLHTDPKDYPDGKQFRHAYHHPDDLRPNHFWVDWFTEFDAGDNTRQNGLEFVEGLWAEKLAAIAIVASVAIVVVSVVWCLLGGNLQTVFTVMGFVLTLVTAEIALAALYYQVSLPQ